MASGRHRERQGGRPTATQSSVGKGIRTRIRSASCVDNSHRMLQQMHASSKGRERPLHQLGAREVAALREPAVPSAVYEYTTCDEIERSGWSRAEERRSPFVLPVPGEHMPLPVLSRRACAVPAASVPRVRARVCVRTFGDTWDDHFVRFLNTTLDTGGRHAPMA